MARLSGKRKRTRTDVLGSRVKGSSSVVLSRSTSSATSCRWETVSPASTPLLPALSVIGFMLLF